MRLIAIAVILLAGCSPARDAALKYENAKKAGASFSALCARANEVVDAYLDEGNEAMVEKWASTARFDCAMGRLQAPYP